MLEDAFTTRRTGIVFAGGQGAILFSSTLLSDAAVQAAALPPASIIVTPHGLQVVSPDGKHANPIVSVNPFQYTLVVESPETSDIVLSTEEDNDRALIVKESNHSLLTVHNDILHLEAGRYLYEISWLGGGRFTLDSLDGVTKYRLTPICKGDIKTALTWQGHLVLNKADDFRLCHDKLPGEEDEVTLKYTGIPFLHARFSYAT